MVSAFHMDMHSDGHMHAQCACHGKFITYMINVHKGVISGFVPYLTLEHVHVHVH